MKLLRRLSGVRAVGLALVVAVGVSVSVATAPAGAHEGTGEITVETSEPTQDGGVRYTVRLIWSNDKHPALAATVTATAIGPTGAPQTPIVLTPVDQDGRYQAVVAFPSPGSWTVRFTAVTPVATTQVTRDVAAPAPSSTTRPTETPTWAPSSGRIPPTVADETAQAPAAADEPSVPARAWAIGSVALLLLIVGVGMVARRRTRPRA